MHNRQSFIPLYILVSKRVRPHFVNDDTIFLLRINSLYFYALASRLIYFKIISIVAFLTLHFPYFNKNREECKDMVRKAYDINSKVRFKVQLFVWIDLLIHILQA